MIQISQPFISEEEVQAASAVLRSGQLSQGPKVKEFEEAFARYCGTTYAVAVNNGTAALHCALFALGIQEGDEVITTPFTFVATANAILMQRAKVVFADISEDDFNIDPTSIEQKITSKTKAIIPVDLYGQIYNVEEINAIARRHQLKVIEDAAQSVAAEYGGKKSGNFADAATFSFYATKNLTAGIGGMITTNNEEVMKKMKFFRHHGQDEATQYDYLMFGYNYRMMDMIAAIGLVQLKKIDSFTDTRREHAKRFTLGLQGIPGLILPNEKNNFKHCWHQYTLRVTSECRVRRDELIVRLLEKGIQCKIYYPKPLHLYPQFASYGFRAGDLPVAERLAEEVVSLPVHPLVRGKDVDFIIDTIRSITL